jgi:DNA-binding NtrC family response regulator
MACVLVVEDESAIREILVDTIRDAGFEIVEAASADVAVQLLELTRLQLVVTDINLPGNLNGIDLAFAARKSRPDIPVIFMSGLPAMLEKAQTLGGPTAFLQKPFNLQLLMDEICRLDDRIGNQKVVPLERSRPLAPSLMPRTINDLQTILIVEDEVLIAETFATMAEAAGMHVCGMAASADQAIALAELHDPSLILMDVRLRGAKDGVAAALAIREFSLVPVIYVTGSRELETVRRIETDKSASILYKPVGAHQLGSLIRQLLMPPI